MSPKLLEMLIRHEGMKLKPYTCPSGKLTIGVGRNLEDMGISKDEALTLLENDVARLALELWPFDWYNRLSPVRQEVILNMAFNVGVTRLLKFKKMISCLKAEDFTGAASEMLSSQWSAQVGKRATELAEMMRSDSYPAS